MKKVLTEELIYEILSVVEEIPYGRVLRIADDYGDYPCHRVVNHAGRLAPHFPGQRELLEREGVEFLPSGHVDMARFRWDC